MSEPETEWEDRFTYAYICDDKDNPGHLAWSFSRDYRDTIVETRARLSKMFEGHKFALLSEEMPIDKTVRRYLPVEMYDIGCGERILIFRWESY